MRTLLTLCTHVATQSHNNWQRTTNAWTRASIASLPDHLLRCASQKEPCVQGKSLAMRLTRTDADTHTTYTHTRNSTRTHSTSRRPGEAYNRAGTICRAVGAQDVAPLGLRLEASCWG